MSAASGQPAPPLPFEPTSLGGGRADSLLERAGFHLPKGEGGGFETAAGTEHNRIHELRLSLGRSRVSMEGAPLQAHPSDDPSEQAWMLGLMPHVAALCELSALSDAAPSEGQRVPRGVFARAIAAFEEQMLSMQYVQASSGEIVVPMRWRMICARRPHA